MRGPEVRFWEITAAAARFLLRRILGARDVGGLGAESANWFPLPLNRRQHVETLIDDPAMPFIYSPGPGLLGPICPDGTRGCIDQRPSLLRQPRSRDEKKLG